MADVRRTEISESAIERAARTRLLIEVGGLALKAGLFDVSDSANLNRAELYGAFLEIAGSGSGRSGMAHRQRWRTLGLKMWNLQREDAP